MTCRRRHKSIIQLLDDFNGVEATKKIRIKHIVNLSIASYIYKQYLFFLLCLTLRWKRRASFRMLTMDYEHWRHIDNASNQLLSTPISSKATHKMRFIVQSSVSWKMSVVLRVYVRQYNWFEQHTRECKKSKRIECGERQRNLFIFVFFYSFRFSFTTWDVCV